MLECREFSNSVRKNNPYSVEDARAKATMIQGLALVEIAEALTELLKLAKETGEPYQEEGR